MNSECGRPDAVPLADAVFAEVARALAGLAGSGEETEIDLLGLPLGPADRAALADRLGTGEVVVTLEVLGRSEIRETAFAGVWWVRHLGADDALAAEEIHVTRIPEIVMSHPDDVVHAARRMAEAVACPDEGRTPPSDTEDTSLG